MQSDEWRKFQEGVGRKTFHLSDESFWANIVEHRLPLVGKYFYVPRGPLFGFKEEMPEQVRHDIDGLIKLAEKNNAGWIRIEPETESILEMIKKAVGADKEGAVGADLVSARNGMKYEIVKAPHDVQPRETFVIDIAKSEEELLAGMKAKTRYNIKLSQKHNVLVKVISNDKIQISNQIQRPNDKEERHYFSEFLRLTQVMAKRQGITAHPDNYYRQMFETIPSDILKLYVAEYEGRVIAANLVVFYGETCTYLHGASDDEYRNVMAPYLLQWQQIRDAKKTGCVRYDFGGVKTGIKLPHPNPLLIKERGKEPSPLQGEGGPPAGGPDEVNSWKGITRFKLGFSPGTVPTVYPGSYDLVIDRKKYELYRLIQKIKAAI